LLRCNKYVEVDFILFAARIRPTDPYMDRIHTHLTVDCPSETWVQ